MFSYTAYGLGIQSGLPLPELRTGEMGPDIVVRLETLPSRPFPSDSHAPTEAFLSWEGVGWFRISQGREILIQPAHGVDDRVLRLFLLGPVLAGLLHQRGRVVLHASAVAMDDGVVAFLGGQGWGKSTTAAALHSHGYPLVADDVTTVEIVGERANVHYGFPLIKLWPDTAFGLGYEPGALPRLRPEFEKRALRVNSNAPMIPLPLKCLYVLADGIDHTIEPIGKQDTLMELVRHTYGIRRLHTVNVGSHFSQCAILVNTIPVRRLTRPRDLASLPELVRLIETDRVPVPC